MLRNDQAVAMTGPNRNSTPTPLVGHHQAFSFDQQPQAQLQYFTSRSNGTCVPLIPADELPLSVRLAGVPRVLAFDQTAGMQHVGPSMHTGRMLELDASSGIPTAAASMMQRSTSNPGGVAAGHTKSQHAADGRIFMAPDALVRQGLGYTNASGVSHSSNATMQDRPTSAAATATSWRRNNETADDIQATIDAITGVSSQKPRTPPASGAEPDQEKKEFCTYWIRTGECDYTQQGCLYKHEMPDRAALQKIGFRGVPRWWQERNAVIKMGVGAGEKQASAAAPKSSEWLKKAKASSDVDDSEDSEADRADAASKKSDKVRAFKAAITAAAPARAATPTEPRAPAGDLIDFAPLIPTSSPSTPSLSPTGSRNSSPPSSPPTPSTIPLASATTAKNDSFQVFVPANEDSTTHIAAAQARRVALRARVPKVAPPLDRQIQHQQKAGGLRLTPGAAKERVRAERMAEKVQQSLAEHRSKTATSRGGRSTQAVRKPGRKIVA